MADDGVAVVPMSVRRCRPEELDGAFAVWLAANEARGRFPSTARRARVRAKLADSEAFSIVAVDQGSVVGMALGEPGRLADGEGPRDFSLLHVSMAFVDPARWGTGVGRALLDELFAEARRAGYLRAALWTASDNERARRLYVGSGMHPTGRRKTLASYGAVIQFGVELGDDVR